MTNAARYQTFGTKSDAAQSIVAHNEDVDVTDPDDSDSDNASSDNGDVPSISASMAAKFSIEDLHGRIPHDKARDLLDRINSDLHKQTSDSPTYAETLRLLQDLCGHFLTIPKSFMLKNSTERMSLDGEARLPCIVAAYWKGINLRLWLFERWSCLRGIGKPLQDVG
ncbi:hypothetical protein DL93DRAFT_2233715 [Clavulina sp. PMI_390]|nr:hypothetical protein DL93DRAFT_2233715 [Clavulina sp. PMI_390]